MPASFTNFTHPQPTDKRNSPSLAGTMDAVQDAIESLETEVGLTTGATLNSIWRALKSTTAGHRHDGEDSRKTRVTDLDVTDLTANRLVAVKADGTGLETELAPAVNSITEATADTGVTVEGFRFKDNYPVLWDGWMLANVAWTYASASTFTISGDYTDRIAIGDKVRLKQGAGYKYFYVTAASYSNPTTTVTVTGGSDYTLANSAITDNYISKSESPIGFPEFFAYTVSITGSSGNPNVGNGSITGRFSMKGKLVRLSIVLIYGSSGTSAGSGTWMLSLPISASSSITTQVLMLQLLDNGTSRMPGMANIYSSDTTKFSEMWVADTKTAGALISNNNPITWANGDQIVIDGTYFI